MQEFGVGDMVLVEAQIIEKDNNSCIPYLVDHESTQFRVRYVYPLPDETYERGQADAWKTARKIVAKKENGGLNALEIAQIFGTKYFAEYEEIFDDFTAEGAADKISYWKKKNIHIEDQVARIDGTKLGVVMSIDEHSGNCFVWWGDGTASEEHKGLLVNTGRKINIAKMLKKIGGTE